MPERLETGSSSRADTDTAPARAPAKETVPRLLVRALVAVADDLALALGALLGGMSPNYSEWRECVYFAPILQLLAAHRWVLV